MGELETKDKETKIHNASRESLEVRLNLLKDQVQALEENADQCFSNGLGAS